MKWVSMVAQEDAHDLELRYFFPRYALQAYLVGWHMPQGKPSQAGEQVAEQSGEAQSAQKIVRNALLPASLICAILKDNTCVIL